MMHSDHRHRVFYKSLPKVELHRHLEGTLRLTTMMEIARKHGLDLPFDRTGELRPLVQVQANEPFTNKNFLSKFQVLRQFYQSPQIIQRVTREAIADAAADNIRHMEIRFTPVALTRARGFSLEDAMDWVIESTREASREYDITVALMASVNRHESVDLAAQVAKLAADRVRRGIVGLDLAGDETSKPGTDFAGVFAEARQAGLKVTVHAGEWGEPDNVVEAIETLQADRVAHGVRVMEDLNVVALSVERGIPFEVCLTSNYQSGVVDSLNMHPLPKMMRAGLTVTINTDDPSISQVDLSDEYELACEVLGLTLEELRESILAAARSSFLSDDGRLTLVQSLKKELPLESRNL